MKHRLFLFLLGLALTSCQTPPLRSGIQPNYMAINPAAVVAVPVFVLANPANSNSSVDHSIILSEQIIPLIESKIIASFDHQPNINGYPFSVVRKTISTQNENILTRLDQSIHETAQRFSSRDIKTRLLITKACLNRKNFLEFYSYCLAQNPEWISSLNSLSAHVLNADSALVVVIDHLSEDTTHKQHEIQASVAVLLVDTNNGKLIWGNEKTVKKESSTQNEKLPSWAELINDIFTQDFWNEFPGRIQR